MLEYAIQFKGHPCFRDDWAGFDRLTPITIIIGKNNSGKSLLMDLVRVASGQKLELYENIVYRHGLLVDEDILRSLLEGSYARSLPARGSRSEYYRTLLLGKRLWWRPETHATHRAYDYAEFDETLDQLRSDFGRDHKRRTD